MKSIIICVYQSIFRSILLLKNRFIVLDERAFKQTVVIPMGTICVPILTDLFLFSHEAAGMSELLKKKRNNVSTILFYLFTIYMIPFHKVITCSSTHRLSCVCFTLWPSPGNWQWETLRQKRSFYFFHYKLSFYM